MNSFFSSAVSWSHSFSRSFGQGVSLAFCGMTPSRFWFAKIVLAQLVPALVEQLHVADLLNPLRRRVVRRVGAAGRVVDEEGLVGRQRVDAVHVVDRLVGHRRHQVVAGVALERIDRRGVADEVARLPLVGVAAHEAVEVLKAHAGRPLIERTGLAA